MSCTQKDHDALKSSPLLFQTATTPLRGFTDETHAVIDDGEERSILRNCRRCHSTIARVVGPSLPGGV